MKKTIKLYFFVISLFLTFAILFSQITVFAEDLEFDEETSTDFSVIAQEEYDYDEIDESATDDDLIELTEENGYIHITEEEKQNIVENDPYGTAIEAGQIPDYYLSEEAQNGATTYALQNRYTDSFETLTIKGKKASNTDFTDMLKPDDIRISSDASTDYYSLQGSCYDGTNYYFCFLVKDNNGNEIDARIVKGTINSSGVFKKTAMAKGLYSKLGHVNDMTYNKDTGKLVVVCCIENKHNLIYTISKDDFTSSVTGSKFEKHILPCMITAIDYNPTRTRYVARLQETANAYAILDSDFNLEKTFGYKQVEEKNWVTQGICADNIYIYSLSFYDPKENDKKNERENRLRIFDWDGNLVKSYEFFIDKNLDDEDLKDARIYEFENILIAKDKILIGTSCIVSKQSRSFSYIDMSKFTYHMQFCPDSKVDTYAGVYGNGNVTAVMFRGLLTPLRKFRVSVTGKKFTGWTAYRVEDKTWLYCNSDRSVKKWCKAGEQPSGYSKYVYEDKQEVSKTGEAGDHVLMCAQWSSTSKFTVSFMSNGGKGTMTDQTVTHGTATALKANEFRKTSRSFNSWNAYWSEKNRWYYESADGSSKGWYKEGCEPVGYKKYTYDDKQSVSSTVHAGGHVYMYAVWKEYYIQYALNQKEKTTSNKMIKYHQIIEQHTAKYATGVENDIKIFNAPYKHNGDGYVVGTITLKGYNLYRKEIDKWMYIKGSTKAWYKYDKAPSGYELYERTVLSDEVYLGATALPGEHLVLVAVWSDS